MHCRRFTNLMSAFIDGELPGVDMLQMRRHAEECAECAAELESLRSVKRAVAGLRPVSPRAGFQEAVLARLDQVSIPPYQRLLERMLQLAHTRLSPVGAALTACAVALALLSAGGMDAVLWQPKTDAVQPLPMDARVQSISYMPELLGGRIPVLRTEPLVVASQPPRLGESAFQMAVLNR